MKQFDNLVIFSLKSIPLQRSAIKLDTQLQWNKGLGTLSHKTQSWGKNNVEKNKERNRRKPNKKKVPKSVCEQLFQPGLIFP